MFKSSTFYNKDSCTSILVSLCQVCLTHTTTVDSPLRTLFEVWMKCIYYHVCTYVQRTDRDLFESGTSIKFSWWKWRQRWDLYYTLSGLGYAFPYTYILFSNLCFHFFEDLGIPWILDSVLGFLLCVIIGIKSLIQWKLLNIFCSKIVLPLENEEF